MKEFVFIPLCQRWIITEKLMKCKLEFMNMQAQWDDALFNNITSGKNHFHKMNGDVGMAGWK